MNVANFIFRLLHILNLPTLLVLIPFHSPYTPSINYAHLFVDYINSSIDCDNTFADCAHLSIDYANESNDYANTLDAKMNIFVDLVDTLDKLPSYICIPKPSLL
jgi:hypothetical protein